MDSSIALLQHTFVFVKVLSSKKKAFWKKKLGQILHTFTPVLLTNVHTYVYCIFTWAPNATTGFTDRRWHSGKLMGRIAKYCTQGSVAILLNNTTLVKVKNTVQQSYS